LDSDKRKSKVKRQMAKVKSASPPRRPEQAATPLPFAICLLPFDFLFTTASARATAA
jgi:hypothetical protein